MSKLYSLTENKPPIISTEDVGIDVIDPSDEVEDLERYTSMSLESVKTALGQFEMVRTMRDSLTGKSLLSDAYMSSMESCRATIASWQYNNKPTSIPAMESFSNPYAANASHQIALEGIGAFVKKIWDKLKKFFLDFFKRVTLFFKRVLRLELDLQSYETYSQQLVGKLKLNKGVNKDFGPIASKLPRMLASGGMERIDDMWLVRQGFDKITALQESIKRIGFNSGSPLVEGSSFTAIENSVVALSGIIDSGRVSKADVDAAESAIKAQMATLLDSIFTYRVNSDRDLPDDVFERMNDEYTRTTTSGASFSVQAVAEVSDGYSALPSGVNMFLFHVQHKDLYITSSSSDNTHVRQTIDGVKSLENLIAMEEDYRKKFKPFSMKGTDKFVDKANDKIVKLLKLLEAKLERIESGTQSKGEMKSTSELVKEAYDKNIMTGQGDFAAFEEAIYNVFKQNIDEHTANSMKFSVTQCLDESDAAGALAKINDRFFAVYPGTEKLLQEALQAGMDAALSNESSSGVSQEVTDAVKQLNKMLLNFLTRLQVILRDIMTNFYSVYSQLKFELVKYIYESARQFSY